MRREYKTKGILPPGYAECEYIESTGTQYIRTTVNARSVKKYDATAMDVNLRKTVVICGYSVDFTPLAFTGDIGLGTISSCFNKKWWGTNSYDTSSFLDMSFIQDGTNSKLYVNGELATINAGNAGTFIYPSISVPNVNLIIFTTYNTIWMAEIKLKHLALYNSNGNAIADMYPALRTSDNKPGLYDLCGSICSLTNTPFYINAGTGEFLYQLK